MGQRSSCCSEEVQEAPKVEVVHHRQEFENTNWKVCVPIEAQEVQDSRAEPTTTTTAIPSRTSLAQYRLQKMDHLVVDRDILRGIPLRESLNNVGRLWRKSPIDLDENEKKLLWSRSKNVEGFDWFLSHTWLTPGRWKVLSLVLESCWPVWLTAWLVLVTLAIVLCAFEILPMNGTWKPAIMGFTSPCPLGGWLIVASWLAPFFGVGIYFGFSESCWSSPICFLDVVSIHQTDTELMERGVYGLGGFLKMSKELRIMWSAPYLTRLWCVFEVAAFRTANPDGKIVLRPLAVEIGVSALFFACSLGTTSYFVAVYWASFDATAVGVEDLVMLPGLLPSLIAIRVLRRQSFMGRVLLSQLRNFDVDKAECRDSFDRQYIEAAILQWYGSKEQFAEYVRGPLALELLRTLSSNNATITAYLFIVLSGPVASSLELCLSLWMGGAPWEAILSRFIGVVIGTDFFFISFVILVTMAMCDVFSKPCCGFALPSSLQLILLWFISAGSFAFGNSLGSEASNHSIWTSIAYALVTFTLTYLLRLYTKWMLLSGRASSVYGE